MRLAIRNDMAKATLHMLHTCPFCWKVRGLIEYLNLDVDYVSVNGLKIKKAVSFAGDWGKVPVYTDETGKFHTDSTPIMKFIDERYNNSDLQPSEDNERVLEWLDWADTKMSKATVPILYGTLGSAFKTTTRISKLEKFGFISKRLYAWAGFPIMWGIIAKKRVKQDGRKPKNCGTTYLLNSQMNITVKISLAARNQTLLIFPYLVICDQSHHSHNFPC